MATSRAKFLNRVTINGLNNLGRRVDEPKRFLEWDAWRMRIHPSPIVSRAIDGELSEMLWPNVDDHSEWCASKWFQK